ncbi:MAG: glycosyltransferase [Gemmatimonadaceae bacterium]|nr:glycosyltransferase [Gemmatimonadaceae bacterium]
MQRPEVRGKFLFVGDEKFVVRGVTYGPFRPGPDGEYHTPPQVRADFAAMAAHGFNTVRVYTVPPLWLLDIAREHGLRVMVGLPWEQHVTFLDEPRRARDIERRVREGVRACERHPAVLCYAIGNEIPSNIVRWHGAPKIERFLGRLYAAAKREDPGALAVYVNYPTTEYLRAPTDFVCFNVYLESREKLSAYLARLHSLAGDVPVVMAEIGLDSRRNGAARQAEVMRWQVETALTEGCAGALAFSWTDEWYRGGAEITDWSFGLVDRERRPKPALDAVREAFAQCAEPNGTPHPRVSVVVCTHNGSRTLRECLDGISRLRYPDYEVIVIDDGSRDHSAEIAREFDVRLISTPNQGLSAARNLGAREATGRIVAYIDDDATPDPDWLLYLARTYASGDFVAVGGPNIPPPGDGLIAECVARAPGGPMHVMLTDRVAEHIPGCNMSFDRERLLAIGGFDTQFRVAGDDVDVCWRLQERGWQIAFSPSAVVWHHRRNSVKTYLRQQKGYGRAEAMLERKWPQKYNAAGHVAWGGRIYAPFMAYLSRRIGHIYHGTFGTALFQSVYQPAPSAWATVLMVPEWYLLILMLALLSALGLLWSPLLAALPFLFLTVSASVVHAALKARVPFPAAPAASTPWRAVRFVLTAMLHLLQPVARLIGRLRGGLSPWRWSHTGWSAPVPRNLTQWSETWCSQPERATAIESALRNHRATTVRGGDFDSWDLEIRGGVLGGARLRLATEEHGAGRQLIRLRVLPRFSLGPALIASALVAVAALALYEGEVVVGTVLLASALAVALRQLYECGGAVAVARRVFDQSRVGQ